MLPWFKADPGSARHPVMARDKVLPGAFQLAENTRSPGCPGSQMAELSVLSWQQAQTG